jgi:hypothetical protein
LRFVRADHAEGESWGMPVTVDSVGNVGYDASLEVVNGYPAIAYVRLIDSELKFVRASDRDGTAWGAPVTVEPWGGTSFLHASLVVVNGQPAIAYGSEWPDELRYVRSMDVDGTTWGTPVTVDGALTGEHASLALVNGRPAIAYYTKTRSAPSDLGNLNYVRAGDADGTTWGTSLIVDGNVDDDIGKYASLAVVDGRPAIAYYDAIAGDLKYVRASDADGSAWGTPLTFSSDDDIGQYASLAAFLWGPPAIACYNATRGDLMYVQAEDPEGTSWSAMITVDVAGDVGQHASLAEVNSRPGIAYYDATNQSLRYATPKR